MRRRKLLAGLAALPWLARVHGAPVAKVPLARMSEPWSAEEFEFDAPGDRQPGILVRLPQDRWYASSMLCSHNSCKLMFVRDLAMARDSFSVKAANPILGCPCHFSVFDITQGGKVMTGPAPKPPLQLKVRIAGDSAFIEP